MRGTPILAPKSVVSQKMSNPVLQMTPLFIQNLKMGMFAKKHKKTKLNTLKNNQDPSGIRITAFILNLPSTLIS